MSDVKWVAGQGFTVSVDMSEIKPVLENIRSYDTRTQAAIEQAIKTSTENIKKRAKEKVGVRSGKLKGSIRAKFDEKAATGLVYTKRRIAHLVEGGAAATEIRPKKWKALGIPMASGGKTYIKSAKIPKREAKPFMKPALEEETLIKAVTEAVKKV